MAKKNRSSGPGNQPPPLKVMVEQHDEALPSQGGTVSSHDGTPPSHDGTVAIVGVGASAGGLEAFREFVKALPDKPDLAIVLVQHLSPHLESSLATLLTHTTRLPVTQLSGETAVAANHIFVIPPNHVLTLHGHKLLLSPRPTGRAQHAPIDVFFHSLARELRDEAIGVILSGSGTDGVEGAQAIRAAGGTVLVQDPDTAKHDGMPQAVIGTGKVDIVLPPGELAKEAVRLAALRREHPHHPGQQGEELALTPPDLASIFTLLKNSSGVDFSQYKLPTIQRRIQRRMALSKAESVAQYIRYLQERPPEVTQLYQDILIHVTRFFREPDSFALLAQEVFPQLLTNRQSDAPLRIWVPACSTGEEPYSVAMALMEVLDARNENVSVQLFATDISETAIEQARAGLFPPSTTEELSPERLQRFFTKTDGNYRINKRVRDACVFARQDLTRDPPFSKLDLIVCRNVLIYLGQAVQSRLISTFHYALKSKGYLVLGSAETVGQHGDLFAVVDKKHRVYRKMLADTPGAMHFSAPYERPISRRAGRPGDEARGAGSVQGEANRLIIDRFAPPGVIVNEDLRIVHFRGQTGKFLEPASGDANLDLLKMCREGLLPGLRPALDSARKKDAPVRREGLRVKTNSHFANVTVEVIPLTPSGEGRHYLVLFQEVAAAAPQLRVVRGKEGKATAGEKQLEIERLQRELVASREYMQSVIHDLEATNEELQSANEEILSSNEELQSTNEELDTAKEELQSTNEELNTVNDELHGRNDELARINSDLVNVLNGVQVAVVIVSGDLRIRRYTPMAEQILNLIPGDIGRPISQIKPNVSIPNLDRLILGVGETMSVEQREVKDAEGRAYSLSVRPYKNVDQRIDGAVISLLDIADLRRHESRAREASEYAEVVMAAVRHPLVVLDSELRVKNANPAFLELFKLQAAEVVERPFFDLEGAGWNTPQLRAAMTDVLPKKKHLENFDMADEFPGVGHKRIRLSTRGITGAGSRPTWILLEIEDVTA